MHHASPGDIWWAMSKSAPYVHQVCLLPENIHTSHFFGMEVLKPPPIVADRALDHAYYSLRSEESRSGLARVYSFKLEPGESTGLHVLHFCGIILCLSDGGGRIETKRGSGDEGVDPYGGAELSRVGGFKWIEGPVDVDARNAGDSVYEAVVVEWLAKGTDVGASSRL